MRRSLRKEKMQIIIRHDLHPAAPAFLIGKNFLIRKRRFFLHFDSQSDLM